jgi:hypothetical protein
VIAHAWERPIGFARTSAPQKGPHELSGIHLGATKYVVSLGNPRTLRIESKAEEDRTMAKEKLQEGNAKLRVRKSWKFSAWSALRRP